MHSCRCGRPLDQFGHHRAACARAGILGKRGFALESVLARVCREAGGRVTTNVLLRELDIGLMNEADGRRLEVVADGLPLFGGAQLAVDTTVVSALRSDGTAIPRAAHTAGVALEAARRRTEGRYPELVGPRARSRLVVFAVEVGGRWSGESQTFISQLARARAEQAWRIRWGGVLCGGTGSRFLSVGASSGSGCDGDTPLFHDVERDLHAAGFVVWRRRAIGLLRTE